MTRKTLDEIRLADFVLEQPKTTSSFIENQFPAIYRENGRELVELVKAYYQFLETHDAQSVYNIRRIYKYRNVDSTLERMLVFFKNKFLNGLFFDQDVPFVVKNILDLYRRKGSKEGIELFFKLFFDSEVEIYFPSQDILKPSASLWKTGSFIQMYPTTNFSLFLRSINKKIYGNKSNAEAFVDNVYFVKVNDAYVPLLFISGVKGEFIGFDNVYSLEPFVSYGRVYGSLRSVSIEQQVAGSGNNEIGDLVDIISNTGVGAKGRIKRVSRDLSGEINFTIQDGNYGYTTSNTDILISDQSAFFGNNEGADFLINERIKQQNANTEVFGTVIGRKSDSIGIYLDYTELDRQILFLDTSGNEFNPNEEIRQENSFGIEVFGNIIDESGGLILVQLDKTKPGVDTQRYFFERLRPVITTQRAENITKQVTDIDDGYFFQSDVVIETVDRETNISVEPFFITEKNTTARADIGTIKNTETITIITDIIENYLNVPLNSNNYSEVPPALLEMSGTRVDANTIPDINTALNQAFVPETFVLGEIDTLTNINPGLNHVSDVFVLARENLFRRFNLQNQILNVTTPPGVLLFEGDIITQTKQIITFEGNVETTEVRGQIVSIKGNNITVKQRTFQSFVADQPIFKQGVSLPITVNTRSRDTTSTPLGLNAIIQGDVETVVGKIQEIEIIDSGIGYQDGSVVEIINTSKQNNQGVDMLGISNSRSQGITEGRWRSFESHINQEKVIQDSFFYQDYSYEITTSIEPNTYESKYRELIHPSGLKLFTKFGKIDVINIDTEILSSVIKFDEILNEPNTVIVSEDGFLYLDANNVIEE